MSNSNASMPQEATLVNYQIRSSRPVVSIITIIHPFPMHPIASSYYYIFIHTLTQVGYFR